MAGINCKITPSGAIDTGTTFKTILQLRAPSNQRLLIKQWAVSFQGINGSQTPIDVQLVRQSTTGIMTTILPIKENNGDPETPQATAGHTATSEPTTTNILESHAIHAQSGYEVIYPFGGEQTVIGGENIGIRVIADASTNCIPFIKYEE